MIKIIKIKNNNNLFLVIKDNNMTILLISGNAGVGKTTSAQYLKEIFENYYKNLPYLHHNNCLGLSTEFALGDNVKKMVLDLFKMFYNVPIRLEDMYHEKTKEMYRKYMQNIGTEICQGYFGKECWCKSIENNIKESLKHYHFVIISDIRFLHEVNYFKENFDKVIVLKIHSTHINKQALNHKSEQEIDLIHEDITLNNVGTLKDLYNELDKIAAKLLTIS